MNAAEVLLHLRKKGWKVVERAETTFVLPDTIAARFPKLPVSLITFLAGLSSCSDSSDTTWFLCQSDFDGTSDSAFTWDEWERLSLDSADGDEDLEAEIRQFWHNHFPFLFSVESGYSFHAVRTSDSGFGRIVQGYEPEFEQVAVVAESFDQFMTDLLT